MIISLALSFYLGKKQKNDLLNRKDEPKIKEETRYEKVENDDIDKIELNRKITKRLLKDLLDYIKDKFSFRKWNGEELYFNSID